MLCYCMESFNILPQPEPKPIGPAFDSWLRRELRELHGSVLREDVPEHWLALLNQKD